VEINREIVPGRPQPAAEREIRQQVGTRRHNHLVDPRIRSDDRRRQRFDQIGEMGVWKMMPERGQRRCGEDNVANLAEANQQDANR